MLMPFTNIQDEGRTIMLKPIKAAQITFYIITASAIILWITSQLVEVSERPTPTQFQAIGLINYHVHLSSNFSVAEAANLSKTTGIKFGIVEHPGQGYKITDDRALRPVHQDVRAVSCIQRATTRLYKLGQGFSRRDA